jgi:hypothetical protein
MAENKKPCLGCTRRKVTQDYNCHSHCPDFLGLKEEDLARAEVIRQKKAAEADVNGVRIKSIRKSQREKESQKCHWKG